MLYAIIGMDVEKNYTYRSESAPFPDQVEHTVEGQALVFNYALPTNTTKRHSQLDWGSM